MEKKIKITLALISISLFLVHAEESETQNVSVTFPKNTNETKAEDVIIIPRLHQRIGRGRRPKPSRLGNAKQPPPASNRRQDAFSSGPGLNITSVSPIELSLGGLTGLQGLPPLSIIQFIKLLVAVTPFIIPLIFVPLLIFTVGIFMIPIGKPTIFVGPGDGDGPVKRGTSSWASVVSPLVNAAQAFILNHEECLERIICEIGGRYLDSSSSNKNQTEPQQSYRQAIGRIANHVNHPLMRRLSKSIVTTRESCSQRKCSITTYLQNFIPK